MQPLLHHIDPTSQYLDCFHISCNFATNPQAQEIPLLHILIGHEHCILWQVQRLSKLYTSVHHESTNE
jgi:hypothetical protein